MKVYLTDEIPAQGKNNPSLPSNTLTTLIKLDGEQHRSSYKLMTSGSTYVRFYSNTYTDQVEITIVNSDFSEIPDSEVYYISYEDYDNKIEKYALKDIPHSDAFFNTAIANGNTEGVITHVPLVRNELAEEANQIVTPESNDEEATVAAIQQTQRQPNTSQLSEETLKVYQAIDEMGDAIAHPVDGAIGAIKQFYNDGIELAEGLSAGVMFFSAIESAKTALFARLFGFDDYANKQLEHAASQLESAKNIDYSEAKSTFDNPAQKGGSHIYEVASLAAAIPAVVKHVGKGAISEINTARKGLDTKIGNIESPGAVIKQEATNSAKSTAIDKPNTSINAETNKTTTTSKGNNTDNKNKLTNGDPVDMVEGDFIQIWPVIRIPGLLPIELTRSYYSTGSAHGIFGKKWFDNWSMSLTLLADTIDFQDVEGNTYTFNTPNNDVQARNHRAPHYLLFGKKDGQLSIQDTRRQLIYNFEQHHTSSFRLTHVRNLHDQYIQFHYDEEHRLIQVIRHDGFTLDLQYKGQALVGIYHSGEQQKQQLVACQYDQQGYLSECDAYQQHHLWHEYSAQGWMTRWHDTDQTDLHITYDDQGRVLSTNSPDGFWTDHFIYNDDLRMNTYIDGEGGHTRYYYDENNLVVRTLDPLGRETRTEWRDYQKISETNDIGDTTRYVYHRDGALAQVHFSDGRFIGYEYNDNGQLTRYISPVGDKWQLIYDDRGNLTTLIDPQNRTQIYEYSQHGELLRTLLANGAQWQYEYNHRNQLIKSTNPYQQSTEYHCDELGRLKQFTDALNNTTQYRYDNTHANLKGSVSDILLPDGVHQHIDYDSEHRVIAVTDGEGKITRYRYGAFDLLLAMVRPDGNEIRFEYDRLTRLKKVINATGDEHYYERDKAGQIIREVDFTGREIQYRYDRLGRRIASRYPDQHEIRWLYSPEGLITQQDVWFDDGIHSERKSTTTYEYNRQLQLICTTNPDSRVEFEYDDAGRLICERINGREIHHQWDEHNETLAQTRFGEQTLRYHHGLIGELTQFQVAQHAPLKLAYTPLGQEYLRHSQTGFASSHHYTSTGLLSHQTAGRGSESYLHALHENPMRPPAASDVNRSWHYDKAYNITAIDDHRWRKTQYRYNQNDQIESTSFNGLQPKTEQFEYDSNLNIQHQTVLPSDAQSALIQLSQQQQAGRVVRKTTARGHQEYYYDKNGRLERKIVHQHGFRPQEWRYLWDTLNQLTACFTPKGDCWRYTYDAFGRRLSKYHVVDTQEQFSSQHLNLQPKIRGWNYLWSGNQMIEEAPMYADGTVAYHCAIQWLYEPNALTPAARYENNKLHYVVTDHQGTPREIFSESGKVSWAGRLNTWGQIDFWGLKNGANDPDYTECHFRFAGQYEDPETGLYYNRFRYYDKDTGQYLSPDPIGLLGGFNPYGYVHNPVGFVDPFGLSSVTVSRWMSPDELQIMQNTGKVVQSSTGTTHVAYPANIDAYGKQAKLGTVYIEFNIPEKSLIKTNDEWAKIVGPDSLEGRLAKRKGLPIPEMPEASNIEIKAHKTVDGIKMTCKK